MRYINEIIIHCSATPEGREVTVDEIRNWHTWPKDYKNYVMYKGKKYNSRKDLPKKVQNKHGRGWSDIGYHYIILLDGTVKPGRPIEKSGAHCKGKNSNSIGICYVGGTEKNNIKIAKDTRTPEQKDSILIEVDELMKKLPTITKVSGHNKYAKKACPAYNVEKEIQINKI